MCRSLLLRSGLFPHAKGQEEAMAEQNDDAVQIDESTIITSDGMADEDFDEKSAMERGKTRLSVCTGRITGVGARCQDRYQVGQEIRVPCTAETSCPIRSGRRLVFSDGCWVIADRIRDCHWVWV
jgi:hypothetical protein